MVVNGRPVKRAKRRVTADLYDFFTFPSDAATGGLDGPFRSNIQVFLSRHARLLPPPSILPLSPPPPAGHLLTWRVGFGLGDAAFCDGETSVTVELDVVEEDVTRSKSVYCDQCRVVGWSCHPVCRKRYHFIIRNNANPLSSSLQKCLCCGALLQKMDSRCHSCNYDFSAENSEEWAHQQLEDPTHLLHGLVHANGYGHLLRVNGRDGGSRYLTGFDIMGFWDRLCGMLRVRKVTVMDISKKHGMEYRLLNAVIFGQPWYGNWGYKFGAGSFGVTAKAYQEAVDTLANLPLPLFFSHSRSQRTALQNAAALYCSLADKQLLTLRDIFSYLNHLLQDSHEHQCHHLSSPRKKFPQVISAGALSSWSKQEIERVEEVMLKLLRAVGRSRWVAWRTLKGASSSSAGSPELLDYCLKGLGGKLTDDQLVVQSQFNDETNTIEFRLESYDQLVADIQRRAVRLSPDQLRRHLKSLYDGMLDRTTVLECKPKEIRESILGAVRKVLDCKQFVKHYDEDPAPYPSSNPNELRIWCNVELFDEPAEYTLPPPELIVLPEGAAMADLKLQVAKAFRETYIVFQRFQPEQVVGYDNVYESNIKRLAETKGMVSVRGRCLAGDGKLARFRMERGIENWEVECICGARDDDGERMMACDGCGVWQHTRCAGIDEQENVPEKFICARCAGCYITSPKLGDEKGKPFKGAISNGG